MLIDHELLSYNFFKQLQNLDFVEQIWLFGSRARGDHKERSDIDIAIVCPQAKDSDWLKLMDIVHHADTLLAIDCVRMDKDKMSAALYQNILKDKRILYMKEQPWKDYFYTLGKAIERLKNVLEHPQLNEIDYLRDASIQRFEFTIELFWKVLKKILAYEKLECTTPRDTLSQAFQYHLIDQEMLWLQMLEDRNNTSHAYKEKEAQIIFEHIKSYLPVFVNTYQKLKDKYKL